MFSSHTNKFQTLPENRFGSKPSPDRIYNTETSPAKEYLAPVPIWNTLKITEEEYYEKYHKQPVPEQAIALENDVIDGEEKEIS